MKKYLGIFIISLFLMPLTVFAENKVKVYIFEAGGCPYCEMEMEYLQGLDSYNKKFEIVKKESYVDHVDWKPGADYQLAIKVANQFQSAGFEDASYTGTPFVVISDIYAATGYSTNLEQYIDEAYEQGDKDAVKCIEDGKDNCISTTQTTAYRDNNTDFANDKVDSNTWVIIIFSIIILGTYLIKSEIDKNEIINEINKKS